MEVNIELAKKLLKERYFINGDNGIRTQHPIRVEDLAFIMQKYTDQQFAIHDVSNSLDLVELERKIDEALDSETSESLKEWLNSKRL